MENERDENDDEFCGVYIVIGETKIIFVNANFYKRCKNFTIAHELGHHFLGHNLINSALVCDKSALDSKNKQRSGRKKEADYFAACFLMPQKLMKQKKAEFYENYSQQMNFFNSTDIQAKTQELII